MRRREFISLLGGAGIAWPLGARAQQPERVRRVGILMPLTADDPYDQTRLAAFLQGLEAAGWRVGQNLQVDTRWGGDVDRIRKSAMELVALTPDQLRTGQHRSVPARRRLCGSHPQGREASEPSSAGANKIRTCRQPEDR